MKKETLFLIAAALVVGVLVGILVSKGGRKTTAPAGTGSPPPPAVNYQQNIAVLEDLVARDPQNRNAWVQLGHNYFDSDQPVKAIEAYNKALDLEPNDADVLTDQGVMFRKLGWYDRAIDNFRKAQKVNPRHLQSLYNLGIVYRYDVQDFSSALEAWNRYLELNPSGPGSDQIRREVEFLRSQPAAGGPQ